MEQKPVDKFVDVTLESLDGLKRASPKPFLLTRINARLTAAKENSNNWTAVGAFLSRPAVAVAGIFLLLLLNLAILFSNGNGNKISETPTSEKDAFAINVISIYDVENP